MGFDYFSVDLAVILKTEALIAMSSMFSKTKLKALNFPANSLNYEFHIMLDTAVYFSMNIVGFT